MSVGIDQKIEVVEDIYARDEEALKKQLQPGETTLDVARRIPARSIHRVYEVLSDEVEQAHRKRVPGVILCPGAACGINTDGNVAHFWPGRDLDFFGFLIAQGDDRKCAIQVRGAIVIILPDGKPGAKVYCSGPNTFSLSETPGAALIGAVRYVQGDKCSVFFKRAGDQRPLNMKVN